jgi:hypothetical protein
MLRLYGMKWSCCQSSQGDEDTRITKKLLLHVTDIHVCRLRRGSHHYHHYPLISCLYLSALSYPPILIPFEFLSPLLELSMISSAR